MKKNSVLFIAIILFAACSKPKADITQFKWLEGQWEGIEGNMKTFEVWQPIKDNRIQGIGGVTADNDTMFAEKLKIEITDGELYYVAALPGSTIPVSFKLIKSENNSSTFENLKNDFPQRVIYTKNPDGSLYARIEGKRSGKDSKQEFNFKKVN